MHAAGKLGPPTVADSAQVPFGQQSLKYLLPSSESNLYCVFSEIKLENLANIDSGRAAAARCWVRWLARELQRQSRIVFSSRFAPGRSSTR